MKHEHYATLPPRQRALVAIMCLKNLGMEPGSMEPRELTVEESATITSDDLLAARAEFETRGGPQVWVEPGERS